MSSEKDIKSIIVIYQLSHSLFCSLHTCSASFTRTMDSLASFEKEIAPKTFVNGHLYTSEDLEMYKKLHAQIVRD